MTVTIRMFAFCVVTFCISSLFCDNLFSTYFRGDHELFDVCPFYGH